MKRRVINNNNDLMMKSDTDEGINSEEKQAMAEDVSKTVEKLRMDFEDVKKSSRWSYLADPFMKYGYNANRDVKEAIFSMFKLHNETLNIWIHLLGGILFVFLCLSWTYYFFFVQHHLDDIYEIEQEIVHALSNAAHKAHEAYVNALAKIPDNVDHAIHHAKTVYKETVDQYVPNRHRFEDKIAHAINKVSNDISSKMANDVHIKETFMSSVHHFLDGIEDFRLKIANELPPKWPILVYCISAAFCLMASAIYHLFLGINEEMYDFLCRLDLAGISITMFGSIVPLVIFTFHCHPYVIAFYLFLGVLAGGSTLYFCFLPAKELHELVVPRVASYLGAGSLLAIPYLDSLYRYGYDSIESKIFVSNGNLFMVCLFYFLGAMIFILRIPERWFPSGAFDIWFSSHQILHAFVFSAAYLHYLGCLQSYEMRLLLSDKCDQQ